jgi:hypothetical protein
MSHQFSTAQLAARKDKRVEWLRAHPEEWAGLPSDKEDVDTLQSVRLAELAGRFKTMGLIGKYAPSGDAKMTVRRCIGVLKAAGATV